MNKCKLSDFKVGDTVYIELQNNAARYNKPNSEECIRECIVESVGRKYVIAGDIKFEETDCNYDGLIQHTQYCVDFVLYDNKQTILDKFEKNKIITELRRNYVGMNELKKLSLDKLRRILKIIKED